MTAAKSRAARAARRAATARAARDAAVDLVWSLVPDVDCKGLCHGSCGPIAMSESERDRIVRRHNVLIPDGVVDAVSGMCPALTQGGRCSVHPSRPTLCRLWGVAERMPCPHGCVPSSGRLLTVEEGAAVLGAAAAVDRIGGGS